MRIVSLGLNPPTYFPQSEMILVSTWRVALHLKISREHHVGIPSIGCKWYDIVRNTNESYVGEIGLSKTMRMILLAHL